MKKKFIAIIYLLILLCTFSIGFATWVFTSDHFFGGTYAPQAEFVDQKATYDGTVHEIAFPTDDNNALRTLVNTNYQAPIIKKDGNPSVDKLITAGTYTIEYIPLDTKLDEFDSFKIKYTIEKRALGFKYAIKDVDTGEIIESTTGREMVFEFDLGEQQFVPYITPTNLVANDACEITFNDMDVPLGIPTSTKTYTISKISNPNYSINSETQKFSIRIRQALVHLELKNNVIEIDYNPNTPLTWSTPTTSYTDSYLDPADNKVKNKTYTFNNQVVTDYFDNKLQFIVKGDTSANPTPIEPNFILDYEYMHNGYYYYGKKPSGLPNLKNAPQEEQIAGSTYKVKIDPKSCENEGYVLDNPYFIFKFKTVQIGGQTGYFTIEDAIEKGKSLTECSMTTVGSIETSKTTVVTSFHQLNLNDLSIDALQQHEYALNSGNWIHASFNGTSSKYIVNDHTIPDCTKRVYSALVIPENITLRLNNGGQLFACGQVGDSGTSGQRGVIINDGKIISSGGRIESYGYIKGLGTIEAYNSSAIVDIFMMYNFPGGSHSSGMNGKVFPLSIYSFHNISCEIKIDASSSFAAFYRQSAGGQDFEGYVSVLGIENHYNKKPQTGLFTLDTKQKNQYIVKKVEKVEVDKKGNVNLTNNLFNRNIYETNQSSSQREVLEIHGNFTDNAMSIEIGGQAVSTSKTVALPIGYMRISIMNDGNGNSVHGQLVNNSYRMYPGSELRIDSGNTLTIAADVNMIAHEADFDESFEYVHLGNPGDWKNTSLVYKRYHSEWFDQTDKSKSCAQIIVNGTLDVQGGFGGRIKTEQEGATVKFSNNTGQINVLKKVEFRKLFGIAPRPSDVITKPFADSPKLRIFGGEYITDSYNSITAGSFESKKAVNGYGWFGKGASQIVYNTGYEIPLDSMNITIGENGYIIQNKDLPQMSRDYYTFDGWYLTPDYSKEIYAGATIYSGTVIYAKWTPIEYTINYINKTNTGHDTTEIVTNENINKFNCLTNEKLINPQSNLVFGGWYLSFDPNGGANGKTFFSDKIESIDSILIQHLNGKTINIYAEWYPADTVEYEVNYESSNSEIPNYIKQEMVIEERLDKYTLQPMNMHNENPTYINYFIKWIVKGDATEKEITKLTKSDFNGGTTITLQAVWKTKEKIDIIPKIGDKVFTSVYLYPGQIFTIPDILGMELPEGIFDKTRGLTGWLVGGGKLDTKIVKTGDKVDLINNVGDTITLTAVYKQKIKFTDYRDKKTIIQTKEGPHSVSRNGTIEIWADYGEEIIIKVKNEGVQTGVIVVNAKDGTYEFKLNNNSSLFGNPGGYTEGKYVITHDVNIESKRSHV